jgi:hypothetical protein
MKLKQLIKLGHFRKTALALSVIGFFSHEIFAGSIERYIYYNTGGTAVSALTNTSEFPNTPSIALQLDDYSPPLYGFQSKEDGTQFGSQGFGSYTIGYLEAPTNGSYTFFIASDDASQLWLSTNETTAGIQLIAQETNSDTALFSGLRLSQRESAPIPLAGGHKYYLQVLHEASTGTGSYVEVGWQRPDGVQEIIPALHLAQYPDNLSSGAGYTAPQFNPQPPGYFGNGGDLPPTIATNEDASLNLQVDVIAVQPTTFQWYSNGVPVVGANLSYLPFVPVHVAANGAVYQVVVTNVYGSLTSSPVQLAIMPDTTPPVVTQVSPQGNPNAVIVNFSKLVDPVTSTSLASYALQVQGGASLAITSATLLAGQQAVELAGAFNFQLGATYQLTVSGIRDQDTTPNTLSPNPTISTFSYAPSTGTFYILTNAITTNFVLYGYGTIVTNGSYDDGGYVDLTDAGQFEQGDLQFASPGTVEQFRLDFKTSISGASATPGDGFSINLANDLPQEPFLNAQAGYSPFVSPSGNRLIIAFDNDRTVNGLVSPAIVVKWQGNILTNVLTGTGGIPPINSADGHWAAVDLQLQRGGNLSLTFDGAVIFTNLPTGYLPVQNAQLEIAAQTSTNYETHWFHDLDVNYAAGDIGPIAFATNPSLTNQTVLENNTASFEAIPSGASPFFYQWYFGGAAISGATNAVLSVVGTAGTAGNYSVVVSNWFSQTSSITATLTVTPDTTPPYLVSARGLASGLNQVVLTFSKPLNPASATNPATYNLGFLTLSSASLSANGETVTLFTGTLERNQLYLFSINGLQDDTAEHNQLTTSASFVTTGDYASQIGLDGAVRYWRFDDPVGSSTVASLTTGADALSLGVATLDGSPTLPALGEPSLVSSEPTDPSILFTAASSQYVAVPNGADINITSGPWFTKSFEFWFNANSVPAPGTTGDAATAGIFKEGAITRGVNFYLWRDPNDPNPDEADLVFSAFNNASDGLGSPWGASAGPPSSTPPVYVQTPIEAGQTYHVVGVFAGNAATNGTLTLYINGVPVAVTNGVGELYNHSGNIEIGAGGTTSLDAQGDQTALGYYDGVLDDLSLYDTALSANSVALHYQLGVNGAAISGAPAVSRLDTLGNPNQILVTFNKEVSQLTATNLANYVLKKASGTVITITNATLLGGDSTVQLLGSFGFLVNSNYTLTVANVTDQSVPANMLSPNPTNLAFAFSAPTGTTFTFNGGLPVGVEIFGTSYSTNSGGFNGSGFIDLTDGITNENGALLFIDRHDIQQFDINFQALLANGSTPPGAGFSVNIATDLPPATFSTPEEGYLPATTFNVSRLVFSFNNQSNNPPSISVVWQGNTLTNLLTGTNGIPPLASTNGNWANVDLNLQLNGNVSVSYAGTTVITNLATGYQPLIGAQVGFGARTTGTAYETHWFNNINLNFADGSIGPVTIPAGGQPQGSTNLENQIVNLSVTPAGAGQFGYQWYFTNAPIAGGTNRILTLSATTNVTGAYFVKVWNSFSSATSAVANVAVQTDLNPAALTNVAAYGGSLNEVILSFDKLLSPASATNLSTYDFVTGGLVINSASLNPSGTAVTLFTSQQQNLQTNKLYINGLLNLAAFPHALNTNATFQSGVSYYLEALSDNPVRYFRFDETNGTVANSDVSVTDTLATAAATYENGVVLGLPPLIPNSTGNAVQLNAASSNYISAVASEKDVSNLTLTNRTVEFWFKANSLPYAQTDEYGDVTNNQAPPLWIEGAGSRYLAIYLYGTDVTTTNPGSALLVITAGNLIGKDGAGSPWGATNTATGWATWTSAYVTTGQVYQVVGQLQGSNVLGAGLLLLYTNGVLVGTDIDNRTDSLGNSLSNAGNNGGPGLLYAHTGDPIREGLGNGVWRHDGVAFSLSDYYNGELDDLSVYNTLLSPSRIATHYQIASTPPLVPGSVAPPTPPVFGSYSITHGSLGINWSGTAQLQRATNLSGPFTTVTNATSPYYEPATNKQAFFRLVQ